MRWMKHLTLAHADAAMSEVLEECGGIAYAIWWLVLEDIAAPMEPGKMVPSATHSVIRWAQICHCSSRVFKSIAERFAEKSLFDLEWTGERLKITVSNILKYKDEYSKKSGHSQEQEQIESREKADTEDKSKTSGALADTSAPVAPENPPVVREVLEAAARLSAPKQPKASKVTNIARGTRIAVETLPDDWAKWAFENCGFERAKAQSVFDEFRDYWVAVSGAKGLKLDWPATWRNRCREVKSRDGPRSQNPNFTRPESATERAIRVGHERIREHGRL